MSRKNLKSAGLLKLVMVMVLGTSSFLLHVWFRTNVVMTSFEMGQLRKELSGLENDLVSLQSLRETKMNPKHLLKLRERWADQGQFFVEARPEKIIFVEEPKLEDSL